jgi:signal transduction histidine kinase
VRGSEGSGLGLSISKTIVERFDGEILLENTAPHGAVMRIEFPSFADSK